MKMFPERREKPRSARRAGVALNRSALTRWQQPGEREEVGGKSSRENVESDGAAGRRVELVGRVVLSGVVDVSSPVTSTELYGVMGQPRHFFEWRSERTMIMVPSSSVSRVGYQRRVVM